MASQGAHPHLRKPKWDHKMGQFKFLTKNIQIIGMLKNLGSYRTNNLREVRVECHFAVEITILILRISWCHLEIRRVIMKVKLRSMRVIHKAEKFSIRHPKNKTKVQWNHVHKLLKSRKPYHQFNNREREILDQETMLRWKSLKHSLKTI